jgi:microcystin-dependent protein
MTFYKWSQVAAADATADDSARAMMAALAKYRDDMAGAIVTGGTSAAYTLSSYQAFDSLTRLNGQTIAFVPHATNGAAVTLSVDGLGAKPLRSAPATELLPGMLVQGTPYTCAYNHADACFYLRDFYVSPYSVPLGACIDYFGASAPNSAFALAYGQAISRTAYAALFALCGTSYGSGDGLTTFNIPDLRGRVCAGKGDMGGVDAGRLSVNYFGSTGTALGATGGAESHTLTLAQLPAGITASGANTISVSSSQTSIPYAVSQGNFNGGSTFPIAYWAGGVSIAANIISSGSNSISVTSNNTGGSPHRTVQPTIICNKMIRII